MTDILPDTHFTPDNGVADDGEHGDTTSQSPRIQDSDIIPDNQRYSRDVLYPAEELDTPFKQKYPPDPFGGEMDEDARVWKVYQDEATIQDGALLDAWNKTLDILLIFAGLFSAVTTAFIIESYRLLQPDFQEYTARALQVLISMHNGSGSLDTVHPLSDPSRVSVSLKSRWINGLWVTSLFTALAVALLCILVKQWLVQYKDRTSPAAPSLRHWARRRSLYYRGLTKWRLPALISTLPLLLHIAVFLFAAGLVLLFTTLDAATANVLLALTAALFCFYVTSIFLAAQQLDCPFSTPLLDELRILAHSFDRWKCRARSPELQDTRRTRSATHLAVLRWLTTISLQRLALSVWSAAQTAQRSVSQFFFRAFQSLNGNALRGSSHYEGHWSIQRAEAAVIARECESGLDAAALQWMVRECSNPEVHVVASMAAAALHPASETVAKLRENGSFLDEIRRIAFQHEFLFSPTRTHAADRSRLARASLCLSQRIWASYFQLEQLDCYDLRLVTTAFRELHHLQLPFPALRDPTRLSWEHNPLRYLTSTGLQVLSVPNWALGRHTRLRLIGGLNVYELDARDINFIVGTTCDAFEISPHTFHKLCDVSCAVNLFCQIVEQPTYHIKDLTRPERILLITRLLFGPKLDFACPEALSFRETKYIWLMSDFTGWAVRELGIFAKFLSHIVSPGILLSPSEDEEDGAIVLRTLHRLLSAARVSSSMFRNVEPDSDMAGTVDAILDSVRKTLCRALSMDHVIDMEEFDPHPIQTVSSAVQTGESATMTTFGPLALLSRVDNGPSIWELLDPGDNGLLPLHPSWSDAAALADILSMYLCLHLRRGTPGLKELVSEFFAYNIYTWYGNGLVSQLKWHYDPPIILRVIVPPSIAHLIELDPEWWPTLREKLPEDDPSARELDEQIRRGEVQPCEKCRPRRVAPLVVHGMITGPGVDNGWQSVTSHWQELGLLESVRTSQDPSSTAMSSAMAPPSGSRSGVPSSHYY